MIELKNIDCIYMKKVKHQLIEQFPDITFYKEHEKVFCIIGRKTYRLVYRNPYSYQLIYIR